MRVLSFCKNFYHHYITRYDRALFLLIIIMACCGGIYLLVNQLTYQYSGIQFITLKNTLAVPPTLLLVLLSMYLRRGAPNITLVTHTYGMLFSILLAMSISDNGIQLTPFQPIDHYIVAFDQLLHFDSIALLQWTHLHHNVHIWFNYTYSALIPELLLTPLLISLLRLRQSCRIYLMSAVIGYIFIQALYYFLPTVAPAGIFHSSLFLKEQHNCYINFYQIRHHLPVNVNSATCLIAFPSPHVFCACVTWYAYKNKWWLWVPIGIINLSMIIATVMLGFHYFADVLGGIGIATLSIFIAHRIDRWCLQDEITREQLYPSQTA